MTGSSRSALGERTAYALAQRITEQILEVLGGRRSLHQLRHRLSGPVAGLLSAGLALNRMERSDFRLRSVHACLTTRSRVEACAVVNTADRARAFVLRLDKEGTQWACTMLSAV